MFYHDKKLQYTVRCDAPNPLFARALQQAIGGVEGEIRVCLQYLFQAWGSRGPVKYRDMLLETGTEEIGHIEMLAHAVALNLENAPVSLQDEMVKGSPAVEAVLGGMDFRQILSTGLAALPSDANGVPFDCSHVYASGNIAADMFANITAESTGRALAVRLYNMTDDPGMKDFLSFLIARDTMHQQQWLAVIEELGLEESLPIPTASRRKWKRPSSVTSFLAHERMAQSRHRAASPRGLPWTGRLNLARRLPSPRGKSQTSAPHAPTPVRKWSKSKWRLQPSSPAADVAETRPAGRVSSRNDSKRLALGRNEQSRVDCCGCTAANFGGNGLLGDLCLDVD
jgi:Mn-containing catalase